MQQLPAAGEGPGCVGTCNAENTSACCCHMRVDDDFTKMAGTSRCMQALTDAPSPASRKQPRRSITNVLRGAILAGDCRSLRTAKHPARS